MALSSAFCRQLVVRSTSSSIFDVALLASCFCASSRPKQTFRNQVRLLYSDEHLGMPSFRRQRAVAAERFSGQMKDQYIERLKTSLEKQPREPVFSDDIKTVITLAETKEDVDLLFQLLRRYLKQANELVPDFRFGPLLMRVLMVTGQCDLALAVYRDAELKPVFQQFTSSWLLLDMLYEHNNCIDALAVYDDFCKLVGEKSIPPACTTLALACCYKMCSDESFTRCLEILKVAQARGSTVGSRGVCFAGFLALKLHKPGICLEILGLRPRSHGITPLNNLRAMALAEMGRTEDAVQILRLAGQRDEPSNSKTRLALGRPTRPTIFPDTLDAINAAAFKSNDKAVLQRMRTLENALRDGGHVIAGQKFDDFLSMSIKLPKKQTQSGSIIGGTKFGTSPLNRRSMKSSSSFKGGEENVEEIAEDEEDMLTLPDEPAQNRAAKR